MKVLLLVGAGTSVELGVPTMAGLAEEFIQHAEQWNTEPELVRSLLGDTLDIEHLIERLDQICTARDSLETIGQDSTILDRADTLRAEVEWFVQHAAERVIPKEAQILWGSVLRASSNTELTIATTNYDRAIELAANAERVVVEDGYLPFGPGETSEWRGFGSRGEQIALIKLHGSTDWYLENNSGLPMKLRHPMPLFGRASLKMLNGLELGSALILPSREKLLTRQPYPRLSQAFLNASDDCELAIVIGSSLRDHHLRGAMQSVAERAPVFLVNRKGATYDISRAIGVAQSASAFLTGTLPLALRSSDPVRALHGVAELRVARSINCLKPLAIALDANADETKRCAAIDALEAAGIPLDSESLRTLIQDPSPKVARYSLCFIPQAPDAEDLLQLAHSCSHAVEGSPYREDLALLESMIADSEKNVPANKSVQPTASGGG